MCAEADAQNVVDLEMGSHAKEWLGVVIATHPYTYLHLKCSAKSPQLLYSLQPIAPSSKWSLIRPFLLIDKRFSQSCSGTRLNLRPVPVLQVHIKNESLAVKISQEVNYAKSLYYEQQLMLPASDLHDSLLLDP